MLILDVVCVIVNLWGGGGVKLQMNCPPIGSVQLSEVETCRRSTSPGNEHELYNDLLNITSFWSNWFPPSLLPPVLCWCGFYTVIPPMTGRGKECECCDVSSFTSTIRPLIRRRCVYPQSCSLPPSQPWPPCVRVCVRACVSVCVCVCVCVCWCSSAHPSTLLL